MSTPRVLNKRTDGVPDGAVYVGRPSKWGNPYRMESLGGEGVGRTEAIRRFRHLAEHGWNDAKRAELRAELRGKNLVCWCAPKPCHADVLLEIANAE